MALKLRRGTDSQRALITPADGELIYTTDTKKLFVGDGTTQGGNPVDTAGAALGSNLSLNNFDLVGTGNINTTGNITVTGTVDGVDPPRWCFLSGSPRGTLLRVEVTCQHSRGHTVVTRRSHVAQLLSGRVARRVFRQSAYLWRGGVEC